MIVAVTGGTGFIGKKLVTRLLEQGDTVRLLVRRDPGVFCETASGSVEIHTCDLVTAKIDDLARVLDGVDVLYHCAAENINLGKMLATNVDGTRNLALAAAGRIAHWVQLSSVGVYGTIGDGEITEETPIAPVNIYEESKSASENIVTESAAQSGYSYSILRPTKVYGVGMSSSNALFQLISIIDKGVFFFIGKPGTSASYIHVDDVVECLFRCGNMPTAKNRIYNISDHRTLEDFVAIISHALHKPTPHLRIPESLARAIARMTFFIPNNPLTEQRINAMVKRAIYSSSRLATELDYRYRITMEKGLAELVDAWKRKTGPHKP